MTHITESDLKTRGIFALEEALRRDSEVILSVKGEGRYAIMDLARYQYLRECELEVALSQARADVAAGRVIRETSREHLSRLDRMK